MYVQLLISEVTRQWYNSLGPDPYSRYRFQVKNEWDRWYELRSFAEYDDDRLSVCTKLQSEGVN